MYFFVKIVDIFLIRLVSKMFGVDDVYIFGSPRSTKKFKPLLLCIQQANNVIHPPSATTRITAVDHRRRRF